MFSEFQLTASHEKEVTADIILRVTLIKDKRAVILWEMAIAYLGEAAYSLHGSVGHNRNPLRCL